MCPLLSLTSMVDLEEITTRNQAFGCRAWPMEVLPGPIFMFELFLGKSNLLNQSKIRIRKQNKWQFKRNICHNYL